MKKNKTRNVVLIAFAIFIAASLGYWYTQTSGPGKYDTFAQCLTEKNAKFYGAFWCPHCQAQKALFGKSKELLPYVECSTADSKGQTEICKNKKIESYPTWEFTTASGTELFPGQKTLVELSEKSGCELPTN